LKACVLILHGCREMGGILKEERESEPEKEKEREISVKNGIVERDRLWKAYANVPNFLSTIYKYQMRPETFTSNAIKFNLFFSFLAIFSHSSKS